MALEAGKYQGTSVLGLLGARGDSMPADALFRRRGLHVQKEDLAVVFAAEETPARLDLEIKRLPIGMIDEVLPELPPNGRQSHSPKVHESSDAFPSCSRSMNFSAHPCSALGQSTRMDLMTDSMR